MTNDDLKRLYAINPNSDYLETFARYTDAGHLIAKKEAKTAFEVVNYATLMKHVGSATNVNYRGVWTSGMSIMKDDMVYLDYTATGIRKFFLAVADIASSIVQPDLDPDHWIEFIEVPLPKAVFIDIDITESGTLTDIQIAQLQGDKGVLIVRGTEVYRLDTTNNNTFVYTQIAYSTLTKSINVIIVDTTAKTWSHFKADVMIVEDAQTITGNKNFTGELKKNNVDVSTIIDDVESITSIDSSVSSSTVTYDTTNGLTITSTGKIIHGVGTTSKEKTFSDIIDLPILAGNGTSFRVNTGNTSLYIDAILDYITINAPVSATNGTLTAEQLTKLQSNASVCIMFNNELYRLQSKEHTSGFLTYAMQEYENNKVITKSITVTISTRGWVLNSVDTGAGKFVSITLTTGQTTGTFTDSEYTILTDNDVNFIETVYDGKTEKYYFDGKSSTTNYREYVCTSVSSGKITQKILTLVTLTKAWSILNIALQNDILTSISGNGHQVLARNASNTALEFIDVTIPDASELWTWNSTTNKFILTVGNEKTVTEFYNYFVSGYTTKGIKVTNVPTSETNAIVYDISIVDTSNQQLSFTSVSGLEYQRKLLVDGQLGTVTYTKHALETSDNKVTSISSVSTDVEYPSAKCVYDEIVKAKSSTFRFVGYLNPTGPTDAKAGELWYATSATGAPPTVFPIQVHTYDGTTWSTTTSDYTPSNFETWSNLNDDHGYYWFGNTWNMIDTSEVLVDDLTINKNASGQLQVKDEGITLAKLAKHTSDAGKGYIIQNDGTTALENIRQYKRISTFAAESGNVYTYYYLDTPSIVGSKSYAIGNYIWDTTEGFKLVSDVGGGGGGGTSPIYVGQVAPGSLFPVTRPDATPLVIGDYVKPYPGSTFPFTIAGVTFSSARDTAVYMSSGNWLLNASVYQKTNETPINDKTTESINGSSSTAVYQADVNAENATAINNKVNKTRKIADITLENDITAQQIEDATKELTATYKNKSIDADNNPITNLEGDNFKASAIGTGLTVDTTTHSINHSNSVTAETTGKIGLVKYDAQGHITELTERPIVDTWSTTTANTNIPSEKLVKDSLDLKQRIIQYATMPTASVDYVGQTVQFIGTTTTDYTHNYFYECILDGTDYKWQNTLVQTSPSGTLEIIATNDSGGLPNIGTFDKTNAEMIQAIQDGKQLVVRKAENGDMYQPITVVTDGTDLQLKFEHFAADTTRKKITQTTMVYDKTSMLYTIYVTETKRLQYTSIPVAYASDLGDIIQYVGTTTTTAPIYINGHFYECVEDTTTAGIYKYVEKSVQSGGGVTFEEYT